MKKTNYPTLKKAGLEFLQIAKRLFLLGIQKSTGGNLSLLAENGDLIVTKPSGISLFDCTLRNLLVIDREGKVLQGDEPPTKELRFHLGIYKVRPDIGGIVHTHAPNATAFGCAHMEIPLLTVHAHRVLKEIPHIPVYGDGTLELATAVTESFSDNGVKAVLLEEHGIIGVGKTLTEAENIVELLEETATIALKTKMLQMAN
jgi:L-ribulose-5-phosphate 4-epimerase